MTSQLRRGDDVFVCTTSPTDGPARILMKTVIDAVISVRNTRPVAVTVDGQIFTPGPSGTAWRLVGSDTDTRFLLPATDENAAAISEGRISRETDLDAAADHEDLRKKITDGQAGVAAVREEIDGHRDVVRHWKQLETGR